MAKTRIDWADKVWNPVTGCTKISEGCRNCYAERMSKRLAGRCGYPKGTPFTVTLHTEKLDEPLKWRKPQRIFVCSMGDLFHEEVPHDYIDRVILRVATNKQHKFLFLTKRPQRALSHFTHHPYGKNWNFDSLKNLYFGVTVEDQQAADERIPLLLKIPAAKRFISIEPMVGPVDFDDISGGDYYCPKCRNYFDIPAQWVSPCCGTATNGGDDYICPECKEEFQEDIEVPECPHCHNIGDGFYLEPALTDCCHKETEGVLLSKLDWVILGGETGPKARPIHPDWVRSVRNQCQAAGVPFFFKQWGEWAGVGSDGVRLGDICISQDGFIDVADKGFFCFANESEGVHLRRVGKKRAGYVIDEQEYREWPE